MTQATTQRGTKLAPHRKRAAKQAKEYRVASGYIIDEFTQDNCHGYGNLLGEKLSPAQAIRRYCWCCQGGHDHPWQCGDGTVDPPYRPYPEVKECATTTCWLWPFRTGRNPNRAHCKGNVKSIGG